MNANEYQKLAMRTNDREATKRLLESMLTCDMKYLLSQNLVFEDEQHLDLGGIFMLAWDCPVRSASSMT